MILAVGDVYAQIPKRGAVEQTMVTAQARAREQDGCIAFTFAEVIDDPGHFVVVQRWRDIGALDAHFGSTAFADYQAAIAPLLVRDSVLEVNFVERSVRPVDSSVLDTGQDD